VTIYGALLCGRINVGIYKKLPLEEKMVLANEICSMIDYEARKMNVTDVPLVFIEDDHEQTLEEKIPSNENENTEQPVNTTPAFRL
jgi:low affinity Fe/Cu permease